jgi:hypothetical protein
MMMNHGFKDIKCSIKLKMKLMIRYVNTEEEGNKSRFCVSPKRLLRNAKIFKIIHADATYKLFWQGFS